MITADPEVFWQEQESLYLCTAKNIQSLIFGGGFGHVAHTFQSLWFKAGEGQTLALDVALQQC